jgi:xylulokinase
MLPGDYIALLMTGECTTTVSGLFRRHVLGFQGRPRVRHLDALFWFDTSFIPEIKPTFSVQGQ